MLPSVLVLPSDHSILTETLPAADTVTSYFDEIYSNAYHDIQILSEQLFGMAVPNQRDASEEYRGQSGQWLPRFLLQMQHSGDSYESAAIEPNYTYSKFNALAVRNTPLSGHIFFAHII